MIKLKKIGSKILTSYFILLGVVLLVTMISYQVLSERYMLREAKIQMQTEGILIAKTLGADRNRVKNSESLILERKLRVAGRFLESKIVVVNKYKKITYTNWSELKNINIDNLIENLDVEGYLIEKIPIINENNETKGYVFLVLELKELNTMNKIMFTTRALSMFVASIVAIIIGYFLKRALTNPIRELMNKMTNFSLHNFPDDFILKTGDEIEELSVCFSSLVNKLKEYDKQQKIFLQNASHELKTPLMSIQGYADAIKEGVVEGEEINESLDIIVDQCVRMKKTIEEITYLTKLENADEIFNFEDINMKHIILPLIKEIKPLAEEKRINIKIVGNLDFQCSLDEYKIKRALLNIVSNGIRYAKEEIIIEFVERETNYDVIIKDDGLGFEPGEESVIFDRFYTGEGGNTGLGLSITKAIIQGHKGKITAKNKEHSGALFKIILPK